MPEENATPTTVAGSSPDSKKVDPVKRGIAFVIDAVIAFIPTLVPVIGGLIGAAYMLLRDALPVEALEFKSVGKKVMGLRVQIEGNPDAKIDYAISAKRNWMFALGPLYSVFRIVPVIGWIVVFLLGLAALALGIVEIVKVFTDPKGKRIGDNIAGTIVLEERAGA